VDTAPDDLDRWWRESYETYLPPENGEAQTDAGAVTEAEADSGGYRDDSLFEQSLQFAMWFAICLAVLVLVLWALQRLGRRTRLLPAADLAQVIGRVYLDKTAVLHFVRTGGKVLVVGVTPNAVQCIAEFDSEIFSDQMAAGAGNEAAGENDKADASAKARKFFEELRTQQGIMGGNGPAPHESHANPDEEIASLRGDIARLQRMLREASDESDR
jgi:flagellar biogenesis protein FliO